MLELAKDSQLLEYKRSSSRQINLRFWAFFRLWPALQYWRSILHFPFSDGVMVKNFKLLSSLPSLMKQSIFESVIFRDVDISHGKRSFFSNTKKDMEINSKMSKNASTRSSSHTPVNFLSKPDIFALVLAFDVVIEALWYVVMKAGHKWINFEKPHFLWLTNHVLWHLGRL